MGGKLLDGRRVALEEAHQIIQEFMSPYAEYITRHMLCGSLRRGKEDAGDIDLVIEVPHEKRLLFSMEIQKDYNVPWNYVRKTILFNNVQLEVHICTDENWGAMILYATGSGGFNARMRLKAAEDGMKLNRYGLWLKGKKIAGRDERAIFKMLSMGYVEPEDRR
jgi:DNA polymerase (family 10)